jgi:outer membrane protein assembly factor BamB
MDPATGDVKWHYEVEGANSVAVAGDRVYFGAAKAGVHCLDLEGRLVWRQSLAQQGTLSPVMMLQGDLLLLSAAAGGTYVVDARSGTLLQFFKPGKGVSAPPTSDGSHVYVLTNSGFFYAFRI